MYNVKNKKFREMKRSVIYTFFFLIYIGKVDL